MGKYVAALGFAVVGGVTVVLWSVLKLTFSVLVVAVDKTADERFSMTYKVPNMTEVVTKRTTATDKINRQIHERDVRFLELNETPTSVSNFSIVRTQTSRQCSLAPHRKVF